MILKLALWNPMMYDLFEEYIMRFISTMLAAGFKYLLIHYWRLIYFEMTEFIGWRTIHGVVILSSRRSSNWTLIK
jgi:hypothetical protein